MLGKVRSVAVIRKDSETSSEESQESHKLPKSQKSKESENAQESLMCEDGKYAFSGEGTEGEPGELFEEETCSLSVGDSLPYGHRLCLDNPDNKVRLRDIGQSRRLLLVGVIGSFTPYCWNRHLFQVLRKSRYYEERDIEYICCISTNDAHTQASWAPFLGCDNSVLMLSDTTTRFTKAIGMDIVIPWLDKTVRSKRYVIYAEDLVVTKMIVAPNDGPHMKWCCEHLMEKESSAEGDDDSETDYWI